MLSDKRKAMFPRRMPATVALTLASFWHAAAVPAALTVKMGHQVKNTVGTVIDLNQGDIACYMTLKDDTGKEFHESAVFELCNKKPSLIGQRVALTYKLQNVQSAECQGDPNCKKSQRLTLVTAATVLEKPSAPAASKRSSFCTATETVVFACQTGSKLVSVCASRDLSPTAGYVQYRFGKPGETLEMTLPAGKVHPRHAAYGKSVEYSDSGAGASWLRFRNASYAYVVYRGIGRWGPNGATMEKQGLAVENKGRVIANLKCTGKDSGELGPQWFEQAGFQPNDNEAFYIPD